MEAAAKLPWLESGENSRKALESGQLTAVLGDRAVLNTLNIREAVPGSPDSQPALGRWRKDLSGCCSSGQLPTWVCLLGEAGMTLERLYEV